MTVHRKKSTITAKRLKFVLAIVTTSIYLIWRAVFTVPWHDSLFAAVFGITLVICEFISAFSMFGLYWSKGKRFTLELPVIEDSDYPHIDVLVITHNEDTELLYKTINACTFLRYPDRSKIHVYVCDDNNRPEMKALADLLGVRYVGLSGNTHAKSGNINNALKYSTSPLVVTFDADMIPFPDFLIKSVPYFMLPYYKKVDDQWVRKEAHEVNHDEKIGYVQTPQSFYNADLFNFNLYSEGYVPNEQDFFSREVNTMYNAVNAAIYTGSNTVLSREAIEKAGGFPVDTITEDFEMGMRIHQQGYISYATEEILAAGLTPDDIRSVIKQRTRWARGVIQSIYNERVPFNRKLTLQQRFVYLSSYIYWWSFFRRLIYISAPIIFTLFNIRVVATDFWTLLLMWLPSYALMAYATQEISGEIRTQRLGEVYETILAPYLVIPVFLESIGVRNNVFSVTRKSKENEGWRAKLFALPYVILLTGAVLGLIRFNYGKYGSELFYGSVINFWLLHHIINLVYALFFSLGRASYRRFERLPRVAQVFVESSAGRIELETSDLSEVGLSLTSKTPVYIPVDEIIKLEMHTLRYRIYLRGSVVRTTLSNDRWHYGVALEPYNGLNKRLYSAIVYDQSNAFLPKQRDIWMTEFETIMHNIEYRVKSHSKSLYIKELLPVLYLNRKVSFDEYDGFIQRFNFERMWVTIHDFAGLNKVYKLQLTDDLVLNCEAEKIDTDPITGFPVVVMRVLNIRDVAYRDDFMSWIEERGDSQ